MREIWKGSPLLAPVAPVLVSCGSMEHPNLITVGWVGIVSTQPPRLSISIRPERYSYGLICESGEFAVNLPTRALTRAVDWCGVKSGRDVDKFAALGLHALEGSAISAPLLAESPAAMECRVFERIPLGSHDLFLADILAVNLESSLLDEKGKLHLERAGLLAYAHGEYYTLGKRVGSFGCSVRKRRPGQTSPKAPAGGRKKGPGKPRP